MFEISYSLCLSFHKINFHSVEETVISVVFKPWQKLSHHLSTNGGEKTTFDKSLSWQIKNTDSYNNKRSKTDFGYD